MGTGHAGSVFGVNSFYRESRGTRLGGRHVTKRSSDPRVAYPEVKIQVHVRDLVRVVDIVVPFAPRGSIFGENLFCRYQGDKWALHATEETGKIQERDRRMIVEGACVYLIRGVSIRGPRGQNSRKIRFGRRLEYGTQR